MGDALALQPPGFDIWGRTWNSPAHQRFAALENQIVASIGRPGPIPVNPLAWTSAATTFLTSTQRAQVVNEVPVERLSAQLSDRLFTEAILAGGGGLAAVVASIFLMGWFGRRLARELRGLRDSANSGAYARLAGGIERLRRGAEACAGAGGGGAGPVVEVLGGGSAGGEDYTGVDVIRESRDPVAGAAVNDVIHLIAELIENATTFSPPNTPVEVRADRVGSGFAVEIEDRGLRLTRDELAEINERLASSTGVGLAYSDQLRLVRVGRPAARA